MNVVTHYSLQVGTDEAAGDGLLRRLSRVEELNVRVSEADAAAHGVPAGLYHVQHVKGWIVADDDCCWPRMVEVLLVPPTLAQARWHRCVGFEAILRYEGRLCRRSAPGGTIDWDEIYEDDEPDPDDRFHTAPTDEQPAD